MTISFRSQEARLAKDIDARSVSYAWSIYKKSLVPVMAAANSGGSPNREDVESAMEAFEFVMRAYCLPTNWIDGIPIEPLPVMAAFTVAEQVNYIRAGKLPGPIELMVRPGAPGVGPQESRDIAIAVVYRKAVKAGLIADRKPSANLADNFGVTTKAVRRWVQESIAEISDFFPEAQTEQARADMIAAAMPKAGVRYRQAGRGSNGRVEFRR
jgi:hypothetical protein